MDAPDGGLVAQTTALDGYLAMGWGPELHLCLGWEAVRSLVQLRRLAQRGEFLSGGARSCRPKGCQVTPTKPQLVRRWFVVALATSSVASLRGGRAFGWGCNLRSR